MKKYLYGLLLWLALPVCAEELQFDLTGIQTHTQNPFDLSFTLDSLNGTSQFSFANGCLGEADVGNVLFSNLSWTINGQTNQLGTQPGSYQLYNTSSSCPGHLYYKFAVPSNLSSADQFWWGIDPPGVSQSTLMASADPVGLLLHEFDGLVAGEDAGCCVYVNTPTSNLELSVNHVVVRSVPEPQTWGLLLAGMAALFVWRRRRVSAS